MAASAMLTAPPLTARAAIGAASDLVSGWFPGTLHRGTPSLMRSLKAAVGPDSQGSAHHPPMSLSPYLFLLSRPRLP